MLDGAPAVAVVGMLQLGPLVPWDARLKPERSIFWARSISMSIMRLLRLACAVPSTSPKSWPLGTWLSSIMASWKPWLVRVAPGSWVPTVRSRLNVAAGIFVCVERGGCVCMCLEGMRARTTIEFVQEQLRSDLK